MKNFLMIAVLMAFTASIMFKCNPGGGKNRVCFSGKVVDSEGNPVIGALVSFGGRKSKSIETSKEGMFEICTESNERYVLNITRFGFGLVSKILIDTATNIEVTMTTATIEEITPEEQNEVVVVQDTIPTPSEPPSATVTENPLYSPLDTIPFVYDGNGRLVAFEASPGIGGSYQATQAFEEQVVGASVEINPQDMEDDPSGVAASFMQVENNSKGTITASLSTIDIYNPDGMPGDYTVLNSDGCRGYMETFGAADINFYRDGKRLQLKKGKFAKLTIPVDTIVLLASGSRIPRTIPLWVYDKETGEWKRDGNNVGVLNKKGTAYEAKLSHFSVYNMDIEFGSPACYRLCNDSTGPANIPTSYYMEIVGPMGNFHTYPFQSGCPGGCGTGINAHVIARMRQDQETGVRIFDGPPPTGRIKSSYVFIAGFPSADVWGTFCSANNALCSGGGTVTISNWTLPTSRPPYMDPADDGTMIQPVIALKVVNVGGVDRIRISWVFIPDVTVTGPNRDYTTLTNQAYFLEWSSDLTFGSVSGTIVITPNTEWLNFIDFNISSITGSTSVPYKFRIRVGPAINNVHSDPSNVCVTPDDGYLLTGC